jgi:gamma-glutamyltranspeptidase/glutathione hydrolase
VRAINGSGRSPQALSMELLQRAGLEVRNDRIADPLHAINVTVPGACAGWCDAAERHGRLGLAALLAPAIALAENGVALER